MHAVIHTYTHRCASLPAKPARCALTCACTAVALKILLFPLPSFVSHRGILSTNHRSLSKTSLFLLLAVNTITSLVSLRGISIQIASFASLLGIWLTEFHQVMGHLSSQSKLEGIGILEECFSWKNCRQAVRAGTGRCMVSIH